MLLDAGGDGLDRAAARCRGAKAIAVDLAGGDAVRDAAPLAVDRCGRIDGWVQCPGATAAGGLLDVAPEEIRRVLDVDLRAAPSRRPSFTGTRSCRRPPSGS